MPFGQYENFDDCITDQTSNKNKSQASAERICGKLQSTLGGKVETLDPFEYSKILSQIERSAKAEAAILEGADYPFDQCVSDQQDKGLSEEDANKVCGAIKAQNSRVQAAQKVVDDWKTAETFQECVGQAKDKYGDDAATICGKLYEKYGTAKIKPTPYDIIDALEAAFPPNFKKKQKQVPFPPQQQQQQAPVQQGPSNNQNQNPTDQTQPNDNQDVPFGGYSDFEACLHDQVNIKGATPEAGVKTCTSMLMAYIKHLKQMQNGQGVNPQGTPGQQGPPPKQAEVDPNIQQTIATTPEAPEPPVIQTASGNSMMGSIVDKYGDNKRFFIKAFLLNANTNINRWGVTKDSLDSNINSFIGKPLILMENFNHPNLNDMSMNHALQYQELFRIGNIIDITHMGDSYYAIIEVTNEAARQSLSSDANFPIYVSPAIAKLAASEQDDSISQWTGIHLAIVDDPAYTVKHATITGQCGGTEQECLLRLRKAHVEKYGYNNCGFCIKGALANKLAHPGNVVALTAASDPTGNASRAIEEGMNKLRAKGKNDDQIREAFSSWEHCHSVMMDEYGDQETADNVCGHLKSIGQAAVSTSTDNQVIETPVIVNASAEPQIVETGISSQHHNPDSTETVRQTMADNANSTVAQPNSVPQTNNQSQSQPANNANNVPTQAQNVPQASSATSTSAGGQQLVNVRDETGLFQQEFERLRARNEALEQTNRNLIARVELLTAENNTIKSDYRRSAFERIITADIIQDPQKRANRIAELLNSNLTPEQVADIYKDFGAPSSQSINTAATPQFNFQTAQATQQPAYEAKAKLKTASVNEKSEADRSWLELRSRIIHSDGSTNQGGIV